MSFCDSSLFTIDKVGVPRHRRDGNTYADKLINGVSLDDSMRWENMGVMYFEETEAPSEYMVGERTVKSEILESTCSSKSHMSREKGEGKFYRKRRIPKKKQKNYPTKPKPKHSWHKRISKLAEELSIPTLDQQMMDVDCAFSDMIIQKEEQERARERAREDAYWDVWKEKVDKNPGKYAIVQLDRHMQPFSIYAPMFYTDEAGQFLHKTDAHPYLKNFNYKTRAVYYFAFWDDECEIPQYTWLSFSDFLRKNFYDHPTGRVNLDRMDVILDIFLKYKFTNWIDWREVWKDMDYTRTARTRYNTFFSGAQKFSTTLRRYPKIHFEDDRSPINYHL
jgi:hypothetical protein